MRELPREGIDYVYVEPDEFLNEGKITEAVLERSRNPIVLIMKEPWSEVVVQYGKIEVMIEENPPRLAFDFAVLENAGIITENLKKDADFKNLLGDIIVATIEDMAQEDNESRNNNP
jgi:hypothetical protein